MDAHRIVGKVARQHRFQLRVEAGHLFGAEACLHPGAGANPPPPRLMAVGRLFIEREGFDISESGGRNVARESAVNPVAAVAGILFP
jgi:hypothetical protein